MIYRGLVILDVDGVLAPHGMPISNKVRIILRNISSYSRIAFASGKPTSYLEGLARGIGLSNAIIIGENGGNIYIPDKCEEIFFEDKVLNDMKYFLVLSGLKLEEVRFQHNLINMTLFPRPPMTTKKLERICNITLNRLENSGIKLYPHIDSIDIVPAKLDKGWAIKRISNELKIPISRFIAVGDGVNDIEMLKLINMNRGMSISVGNNKQLQNISRKNFKTGREALEYILNYIEFCSPGASIIRKGR